MTMRDPNEWAARIIFQSPLSEPFDEDFFGRLIREAQEDGARGEREKVAKAEQQESFWRAIATRNLKGTEDAIGRTAFESLIGQALFAILESTTGAVNCIEFSVHREGGEPLCVVSVTRPEGKNPLVLRAEAEARADRAEKERDEATDAVLSREQEFADLQSELSIAISERDDLKEEIGRLRGFYDVADLRTRMEAMEKWRAETQADIEQAASISAAMVDPRDAKEARDRWQAVVDKKSGA